MIPGRSKMVRIFPGRFSSQELIPVSWRALNETSKHPKAASYVNSEAETVEELLHFLHVSTASQLCEELFCGREVSGFQDNDGDVK
jgi:hypothetical protein